MTPSSFCLAQSRFGYICNLPRGHNGAHHASGPADQIYDTWYTPAANGVPQQGPVPPAEVDAPADTTNRRNQ